MKRFVHSNTYARVKLFNGLLFMCCGVAVIVQIGRGAGLRLEAIPGYVLGLAFIGLGIVRLRGARSIGR